MSHPTWVRGLKPNKRLVQQMDTRSHPTWVRGLKHLFSLQIFYDILVAPYVGAWIETSSSALYRANKAVAPYVGAWIETY